MLFEDEEESSKVAPAAVPASEIASNLRRLPVKINPPAPVFHPLAYRGVVAEWPVEWRERWGRRANALEEKGLSWRDAEAQAFIEVWGEVRAQQSKHSATSNLAASDAERN
jgi:hypothetical protein